MSEVVGRASAVRSTKRTAEVIPVRLVGAEEEESGSSSSEMISEDVKGPWFKPKTGQLFSIVLHRVTLIG
jgi:hypothetical protein